MIRAIGLDIIETERIARAIERYGDRFVNRVLGDDERALFVTRRDKPQFLAGRFAAKEAAIKAMADFLERRPPYSAIQIIHEPGGRPVFRFHPDVAARLSSLACHVSISHDRSVAAAVAVFADRE